MNGNNYEECIGKAIEIKDNEDLYDFHINLD